MSDKYDEAVAYLTEHPREIALAWSVPDMRPGGCLFVPVGPFGSRCGCLTQIRCGGCSAQTPELTAAIRADERIPTTPSDVRPEHLPVFAEWQRRIDKELNRS